METRLTEASGSVSKIAPREYKRLNVPLKFVIRDIKLLKNA